MSTAPRPDARPSQPALAAPADRAERMADRPASLADHANKAPSLRQTALVTGLCALVSLIGLEMAQAQGQGSPTPDVESVRAAASRQAQSQAENAARRVPANARLGILRPGVFPQAVLDGKAITLGPGFRLLDTLNRVVVPASVAGTSQVVAYQSGPVGEVTTAWILTEAERNAIRRRQ